MTNGFDKLLREGLDAQGARDTGECVDAALLAAWFDGTLSHQERTAVEAHAASCSRCQAMIAALVRTDRPAPRSVWRAPAMRWLVPLAVAAAAALVLWIGVSPDRRQPAPASTTARLEAPTPPAAESPVSAGARQSPADTGLAPAPPARQVRAVEDRASATGAKAEGRTDAEARLRRTGPALAAAPTVAPMPVGPMQERVTIAEVPAAPLLPSPQAPPPPAPESAMAKAATPGQPVGQVAEAAGASVVAPAPQANFTTADAAARPLARSVAESVTSAGRAGSGGTVIITPDRTAQWRITGTGQVQRSNDGMTWQTQATGVSQALMAGAAPSRSVCWLVGQHGVVVRTSDGGRTWARIAFPEELDLVTVAAADDQVATVTSASGRQLQTTDGGKSWR